MSMRWKIFAVAFLNAALAVAVAAFAGSWEWPAALFAVSLLCWLPLALRLARDAERLNEAANEMESRSQRMLKGQKRFLGDVAHELNAPIARIQFALGVLEVTVEERCQPDVKALHDEIQEMSSLVAELLAYSRASLDAGAVPLTEVNVMQTVQRASDRENVPVQMHVDSKVMAVAHEGYLVRALGNLLRNSQRYAGAAGPIEVYGRYVGDLVEVIVADHGPGLPESELEQIFEPFYRMDSSRTRSTGGKGLGLAIVKSCVEACGGRVFCRNRQPAGLEMVMHLTPGARKRTGAAA